MITRTLQQIWDELKEQGYESDKGSVHSYIPVYEKLLAPYRETALNVLEIGLFKGDSLRMWEQYFTRAAVLGIDCSVTPHGGMADLRPMIEEGWRIEIFDAENINEVEGRFSRYKFDVIIDDAGHHIEQQLNLYSIWKNYLADGGMYIVEDVQDIDNDWYEFTSLGGLIYDLRSEKNRYDDVLIVIK